MRLEVERIVYPGRRLGRGEGKVVFTDRGIPGERVEVEILRDRKTYAEARTVSILEPSARRVEPRCAHFLACSPYQEMDGALELEVKRGQVEEIMARALKRPVGGIEVVPSPELWGCRNKIGLRVLWEGERAFAAYHEPGRRDAFVRVDRCALVDDRTNETLEAVLALVSSAPFRSVEGIEVRTSRREGRSLVLLELASGHEVEALGKALSAMRRGAGLAGAAAWFPAGRTGRLQTLTGRGFVEESVAGRVFRIGPHSFFQTNVGLLERVFDDIAAAVKRGAKAEPVVADLYCGLGTFGILLAGAAREVFGVEPDPENIAFLKTNLGLNGVGNFAVCEGTTEEWLPEVLDREPDVVILDPPRRGVAAEVVGGLVERPVPLLLYLSCNPTTLARDLQVLLGTYALEGLRIYDFFPHTPHIETLAFLRGNTRPVP